MLHTLKRYFEIYRVQFKNNYVREAVYRTNFISMLAVDLIWVLIEISFFSIIYANVDTLAGWSKHQVYFFLGTFFASDGIFTALFQRSFWEFGDLVRKGELDILLTKPASPLFLALTRYIGISSFLNVFVGLWIMHHYAGPAGFAGGWHWLLAAFWLGIGVFSALLLRLLVSIFVFWTERGFGLSYLYYQMFHLASRPDSIYPKALRYFIMTALPFAFIGSIPARALIHGLKPFEYFMVAGVLIGFVIANTLLWRAGMRRYQSASS